MFAVKRMPVILLSALFTQFVFSAGHTQENWYVESLKAQYDTLHVVFAAPNEEDGEEHRKFTLIINPTFSASTLISIEQRPAHQTRPSPGTVFNHEAYTKLRVSFVSFDNETPEGFSYEHRHQKTVRDTYVVDFSDVEFDDLFAQLNDDSFSSLPVTYPINGCTDGVRSFLDYQNGRDTLFISRHSCDETYIADLVLAEPIVRFAIGKMPYLKDQLLSVWKNETELMLKAE